MVIRLLQMNKRSFSPYIPYSGCKQRIFGQIFSLIRKYHEKLTTIIDLFGGGGHSVVVVYKMDIKLLITNIILDIMHFCYS